MHSTSNKHYSPFSEQENLSITNGIPMYPPWNSQDPKKLATEGKPTIPQGESQSYAKDQLGVKQGETKLLGVPWNEEEDTIQINFPALITIAGREVPGKITKIYDPLGLASPITLEEKMKYREVCETRWNSAKNFPKLQPKT